MTSISKKLITLGSIEFKPLYDGLLPNIEEEEFKRLKEDIEANGVLVPIAIDEKKGVIDGLNRLRAASELGHKTVPFHIHPGLSKKDKKDLAIRLNALRRHWSKKERLNQAEVLRKEGYSLRRIGEVLNLGHETIRRHLKALGDTEDFPETVIGKDGIKRPAKGKRKPCVMLKNAKDTKKAYQDLTGAAGIELPNEIIDGRKLSELVKKHNAKPKNLNDLCDTEIGQTCLLLGDFTIKGSEIASDSVDMIFTDPPYAKDELRLWEELGIFAQRVLKQGGIFLSYSGNMYLPQIHEMLGRHLTYFWTFAVKHTGGNTLVRNMNLQQTYKPVLGFCKPPLNKFWHPFLDMTSGGRSKEFHKWEQPAEEAHHFIKNLCPKNGVLVDPMMGSGSSILAGMSLGMNCTGIEIDTTAFATTKQRVEHVNKKFKKKAA